jgi:hypothetical protein
MPTTGCNWKYTFFLFGVLVYHYIVGEIPFDAIPQVPQVVTAPEFVK